MRLVIVTLLALNAATFLLFGWDKSAARRGRRRVPESWLFLASSLGGSAGAWIGSEVFRHKTKKRSFRLKLVAATALNVLWAWLWWHWR